MTSVLLLEPYFAGSHRSWAEGYAHGSGLDVRIESMPGRFWKWRMHGAAVTLAQRVVGQRPDVILCSDMLDLAAFRGLTHCMDSAPVVLYMHENQLAYPDQQPGEWWSASRRRRAARTDMHYAFINLTSALAADLVAWNSAHNRDSFLEGLAGFLGSLPDERIVDRIADVAARSVVLPVGVDLRALDAERPERRRPGPPRIVWNHRWEHDKGPETFVAAIKALNSSGVPFELIVLGESFSARPQVLDELVPLLGERLLQFGYAADRSSYARWLWEADVVVSTARHEFFGVSIVEAIYCGCRPVLPNGLAYVELIPEQLREGVLYDGFDELVTMLSAACRDVVAAADPGFGDDVEDEEGLCSRLRSRVARYDWCSMAPRYDELLTRVATLRGPPHQRREA